MVRLHTQNENLLHHTCPTRSFGPGADSLTTWPFSVVSRNSRRRALNCEPIFREFMDMVPATCEAREDICDLRRGFATTRIRNHCGSCGHYHRSPVLPVIMQAARVYAH